MDDVVMAIYRIVKATVVKHIDGHEVGSEAKANH